MATLVAWAVWGLLGAVVYGLPRCLAAWMAGPRLALAEFIVVLITGPIVSAGIGPLAAMMIHRSDPASCRAIALVAGFLSNPLGPALVPLLSDPIKRWLGAPLRGSGS